MRSMLLPTLLLLLLSLLTLARAAGTPTTPDRPIRQATRDEVVKRLLRPDRAWTAKRQEVSPGPCYYGPNGFTLEYCYDDIYCDDCPPICHYIDVGGDGPGDPNPEPVTDAASATVFTLDSNGYLYVISPSNGNEGTVGIVDDASFAFYEPSSFPPSYYANCKFNYNAFLGTCPIVCYNAQQFGQGKAGVFYSCSTDSTPIGLASAVPYSPPPFQGCELVTLIAAPPSTS